MRIPIEGADVGARCDSVLVRRLGLGRRQIRRLFEAGEVLVHGPAGTRRARPGAHLAAGAVVEIATEADELGARAAADAAVTLAVVLETTSVVVVDKPAGVPSAPLAPGELGTMANGLVSRYPEMSEIGYGPREPGLCHRLDAGTSGLLLAARSAGAFAALSRALKGGAIDKRYLLVCAPAAALADEGTVTAPLEADPADPRRVRVGGARRCETAYRVLQRFGERALVEARAPLAFRHQLRAHFASLGAPLVGDALYGGEPAAMVGHALHASRLAWRGDAVVEPFDVTSALPARLRELIS